MKSTALPVEYLPTELRIERELDLEEFVELFGALGAMARGVQWWVGDALVACEKQHGEDTFSQAAEALGLEPHTLTNWRWVAARVAASRRRDGLSWSHHAEVARLSAGVQRTVLTKAEREHWTVRQLRDYVAMTYPQSNPQLFGDDDGGNAGERDDVDVQKRLEELDAQLHRGMTAEQAIEAVRFLLPLAKRLTRGGRA